jgi:DNA ligase D-like protein (predicted polymerase)
MASETFTVAGREVPVSNPDKVLFPDAGYTKLDLVQYYLAVSEGALRAAGGRPNVLVRYPNGIDGEFFYQKRAPASRPAWVEVVTLHFPSGREASEVVPRDAAALVWLANLACLELHPHPVRAEDLDHPDELRVDLDPVPGVPWRQVVDVAGVVEAALADVGLVGWPKTSGSRGIHVNVRIEPRWGFDQVRRAALALAREVERRAPELATSKWWKEERHGVFVDYNQNAKDRTVAAAYSVRPKPDARVSAPLAWNEVPVCEPGDFTLATMPTRFADLGDRHAGIDDHPGSLEPLLELSARQEHEGQGDAPWPPHYRKQPGEPPRVQPSKRRAGAKRATGGDERTERASAPRKKGASTRKKTPAGEVEEPKGTRRARATRKGARTRKGAGAAAGTGRRVPKRPLIEIGRAKQKEDALAGLERWKARHPEAAAHLEPADVLIDSMRGRFTTWTRIRVNLQHVPEALRPAQEALDPDEKDLTGWEGFMP